MEYAILLPLYVQVLSLLVFYFLIAFAPLSCFSPHGILHINPESLSVPSANITLVTFDP